MSYFETLRGTIGSGGAGTSAPAIRRPIQLSDSQFTVEQRRLLDCDDIRGAWRDLARRAVQANIFYEPEIALAAAQHLVGGDQIRALLIWDRLTAGRMPVLLGLIPLIPPKSALPLPQQHGLSNSGLASGIPLIDAMRAGEVLARMLDWIANDAAGPRGLFLPRIARDGAFAAALEAIAVARGYTLIRRPHSQHSAFDTAAPADDGDDDAMTRLARSERFKLLRGQLARLGKVAFTDAGGGDGLRDGIEIFLAMEASGPKGEAGTALLLQTRTATFLRMAARGAGRAHHCRLVSLTLNDKPIATALLFENVAAAWLVGLTMDAQFERYAPEEMLVLAIMERRARLKKGGSLHMCLENPVNLNHLRPQIVRTDDLVLHTRSPGLPSRLAAVARQALTSRTKARGNRPA